MVSPLVQHAVESADKAMQLCWSLWQALGDLFEYVMRLIPKFGVHLDLLWWIRR